MLMSLFAIFVIYCFVSAPFKYLVTTVSTFTVGDVLQEIPGLVSGPACLYGFCEIRAVLFLLACKHFEIVPHIQFYETVIIPFLLSLKCLNIYLLSKVRKNRELGLCLIIKIILSVISNKSMGWGLYTCVEESRWIHKGQSVVYPPTTCHFQNAQQGVFLCVSHAKKNRKFQNSCS